MNTADICNLALSHIGQVANIQSINPPDASIEAQLCAQFYPMARRMAIESGCWGFSVRRTALDLLEDNPSSTWMYAYSLPAGMINAISVLASDAVDDYVISWPVNDGYLWPQGYVPVTTGGQYTPQPFQIETNAAGQDILYTNQQDAVLRYTVDVTDATRYTPTFIVALSHLIASYLAGPLIKGTDGVQVGSAQLAMYKQKAAEAEASDANQRRIRPNQVVPWISGR